MSTVLSIRPSQWERDHMSGLVAGSKYISEHHELPSTPIWERLEFRYELNTPRFRYYHPLTASILDRLQCDPVPICDPIPPCEPILPPSCDPPHTICHETPPDCLPPLAVPEPTALVSMAIGVVLMVAWAMRRR